MIETLLISTLIIAIAMVFFLVRVLIHCVMDQDREMRQKSKFAVKEH